MNKENEFDSIGKSFPLDVPPGFFENISEKTLRLAKTRENQHHKRKILLISISVAASVFAIFFLGFSLQNPDAAHKYISSSAKSPQMDIEPVGSSEVMTRIAPIEIQDTNQLLQPVSIAPGSQTDVIPISELLSQLTDEELQQMGAMYKNDLFISESLE